MTCRAVNNPLAWRHDRCPDLHVTWPAATEPDQVREVLARSILADGFDLVLDLDRSAGSYLVDARTGERYLDMFTFFASSALGMNHPALADDEEFRAELAAGRGEQAEQLRRVHACRWPGSSRPSPACWATRRCRTCSSSTAAHWRWRTRSRSPSTGRAGTTRHSGIDPALGTQVLHLRGAFHGRSGYTLSLTNTDPIKVARFPKFDWPRIDAPYLRPGADMDALEAESLRQARAAFEAYPHDIACFIAEPIQGEGGDRHFRPEFFAAMRELCDEYDALLIFDEVQTGCGMTGTAWAYQQLGVAPDVVAFGKKTQVCGMMAGRRVDEVADNVFAVAPGSTRPGAAT